MKLSDVMTVAEAARLWKKADVTVRHACTGTAMKKKFTDEEARLSGSVWLVTRQGMTRLFGECPKPLSTYEFLRQFDKSCPKAQRKL